MNCPKCGSEVVEQAGFCHRCGAALGAADAGFSAEEMALGPVAPEPLAPEPGTAETPDRQERQVKEAPSPTASGTERFAKAVAARGGEEEAETDVWRGGYAPKAMIGAWALTGLLTLVLLVVWIAWIRNGTLWWVLIVGLLLLWLYQAAVLKYRQWSVRYQLTNQRLIHERGILRRVTDRIETLDMDDITFEQTVLERFVGVGTIRIASSDRTDPELILRGIDHVKEVAEKMDDVRRAERRRRGLHIESI